jgi:TldD protein
MTASDPRRFLYRDLDPDGAKRLAPRHLSGHDDGELYLQYSASESFGFDDGRLKTADYHSNSGFGLRGVSGETTAFSHANEISEAAIDRAAATLQLLDPAKGMAAPPPARTNQAMYGADDPLSLIPFTDKVALCQRIDAAARARDPRVVQVSVGLSASWSVIDIVRGDGFVSSDVRPLVRLGVQIVAEQNGRRETGYHGLGGRYLYDNLFDEAQWNRAIDLALAQALANLESVAAPAGEMPVVLGPG